MQAVKFTHICGQELGIFNWQDDHSGVDMLCPRCQKWTQISNGAMMELTTDPQDYISDSVCGVMETTDGKLEVMEIPDAEGAEGY